MSSKLIEQLRAVDPAQTAGRLCEEAAATIERLQAELVQKAEDAEEVKQWYQDALRQNTELRERIKVLEEALKTIAARAHDALEL